MFDKEIEEITQAISDFGTQVFLLRKELETLNATLKRYEENYTRNSELFMPKVPAK